MAFTHSTPTNVVIPRGKAYFSAFAPGSTVAGPEIYWGNTPMANLTGSVQKLDHFSADGPVRTKDRSVVTQVDYKGSLETDNISDTALARFFLGASATVTDAGATITAEDHGAVPADAVVQLGISATRPSGARKVTTVVVKDGVTTKALGTDYTLDAATGRVLCLVAFVDFKADYTIASSTRTQVITSGTQVRGALRIMSENSEGVARDYYMPSVTLSPNGDLALKGDGTNWMSLKFDLEVLVRDSSTAAVYCDGVAV
jgi:hypothetical protein